MKYFFLSFFLLSIMPVFSQAEDNAVCNITFVKGDVRKPCDKKLTGGDTIVFRDVQALKFVSEGSLVNLYHPVFGSFRINKNEMSGVQAHESFIHFIEHLLKIKGRKVSLSSRGDCLCITAQSCFSPDTAVNDKVLLLDSLSFAADQSVYEAESAYYFLQCKRAGKFITKDGRTLTNKLKIVNGNVNLSTADIVFGDTVYDPDTDELVLGLFQSKDGQRMTNLVASLKVRIVSAGELQTYYSSLQNGMQGKDAREVFDTFCQDVYIYFGKPNLCQIKKLVNYIN